MVIMVMMVTAEIAEIVEMRSARTKEESWYGTIRTVHAPHKHGITFAFGQGARNIYISGMVLFFVR